MLLEHTWGRHNTVISSALQFIYICMYVCWCCLVQRGYLLQRLLYYRLFVSLVLCSVVPLWLLSGLSYCECFNIWWAIDRTRCTVIDCCWSKVSLWFLVRSSLVERRRAWGLLPGSIINIFTCKPSVFWSKCKFKLPPSVAEPCKLGLD